MAATSWTACQVLNKPQNGHWNRKSQECWPRDCKVHSIFRLLPLQGRKPAFCVAGMQWSTIVKLQKGAGHQANASMTASSISPSQKVDFYKLQNGSDIRGVAIGVDEEPITLTESIVEVIAAAFVAWLVEKKKVDASRCLTVSVGHDSRISAHSLQDAVSRGITGAGHNVLQYE